MSDAWTWVLSERAAEALESLNPTTQQRFLDKFDAVVTDEFREPIDYTKRLTGMDGWRTLRVGDYRAIVRIHPDDRVMKIGALGHRSSIYDRFP